jgi:hypothetical protein
MPGKLEMLGSNEYSCSVFFNPIVAETELSQRFAMRQQSYKALCPSFAGAEIEVRQRWALYQHSARFSAPAVLIR